MKKKNIVKKNEDFNRIIKKNKGFIADPFVLYVEKTKLDNYYFGFSVGKKLGNAVTRNKLKRQIKNILDKNDYQNGFNCIIMVKRSIANYTFKEKEERLNNALIKCNLIKEKK